MDKFYDQYKSLKSQWYTQINATAQGIIKIIINQIIFGQHIDSFEPSEFGELSDYANLQEMLKYENDMEIMKSIEELPKTIEIFQGIYDELKTTIDSIVQSHPVIKSADPDDFPKYVYPLLDAFKTELDIRKGIVQDISSGFHNNSPYDVLVTVTAVWSGRPYTNDRSLAQYEKFFEYESGAIKTDRLKSSRY
ncbi:hypothetical protein TVAG_142640 [Trichomonas vaginalis G3]|uniref:Uncharacterized protein n=1 Tax=Trichomonas vaginalis (strain ATCC PRA-98 / G3) TaxID=412133 RepID=A2FTJ0_TRIV3|nr:hypothetical protein TVAG_142640 [Trichomonas vaginalis G3]|eukprot:XP_001304710.1 hypothetical protein [Trichomonas vaginalis G3]